ncbi:MAG: hypothetical protein M1838_004047 [Thelocarpon superellum]|nr:MAG: hypothetical protein M1838_004047 [Thelocarpon superellum]
MAGATVTDETCINYCIGEGYIYAGTEYGDECYCGNTLTPGSGAAAAGDCSMACAGAATEQCGGPNRLNLFWSGATPPPAPTVNPGPAGWTSLGCYAEGANGRALTTGETTTGGSGALTVALCTSACKASGFILAGVEYSGECYCGNSFQNGAAPATSGCDMLCNGNSSEYCGGASRLNAYSLNGAATTTGSGTGPTTTPSGPAIVPTIGAYKFLGCYTEATNGRAISAKVIDTPDMNLNYCAGNCSSYTYWGVEYGTECYCGNSLAAGSVLAANQGDCSFTCPGNPSEYCGAGNRLEMYQLNGAASPTTGVSSTTTSSSPTAVGTGSATNLPAGWKYDGCYSEGQGGRAIGGYQDPDNAAMTIESCIAVCEGQNYPVAGMEFASQCFCGDYVANGGSLQPDSQCSMSCSGSSTEECGGPSLLSVYARVPLQVYGVPTTQTTNLPGSWEYQYCVEDNVNQQRTFPWQLILTNTNDANTCLSQCSEYGYMAAGMEYGDECYCGDVVDIENVGATQAPETDCSVPCSGNVSTLCGGGSRLSYYKWTGTPLNVWHYPTGTAAGQYSQLIGGVCVPLMTTMGVNGKVTFVEKYGTGEPNSTGAYELDYSEINNLNLAWRTMHVKTDVFCSAGLTLPDKVGRQINIGGWAEESTFGVRLYWPDGSPGVLGSNDWQENVNELTLQKGRWYPSAMIMVNGSILVVGGEVGSNSPAQPSLELLPGGGPVITLPFLQATDPNNLYPFLCVLPSGGIFIAFYNQALIMDEVTFATTKTLPQIPGAVNSNFSGRTYPQEGTAMLLPQYAPFTDPLGVIICGGSTPTTGLALDNCVTIEPEATNPTWTLERMPSQRVMPCMAALPDGTYLILNGAYHGVAGFGLATGPNLNAVLYNPTLTLNQRFSVMQNTTVARLYHSEAMLLQDGRVLVSGSDPQDGVDPEEYRVEVFTPPYLLSGLPQPTFTLTNKDWTYGETIPFTLKSGSTANLKVSLLGAVTSTHGNSMGQRTLFPAVTCTGNSCEITTPPNAHVCPPSWYQVFVLDGPTPSVSQWVRIGGDPGDLGNWPQFPDFNIPGV